MQAYTHTYHFMVSYVSKCGGGGGANGYVKIPTKIPTIYRLQAESAGVGVPINFPPIFFYAGLPSSTRWCQGRGVLLKGHRGRGRGGARLGAGRRGGGVV